MGVAISKIVPSQEIRIDDLRGKTLAVDGYNMLYQFLTTIRGPDGQPLTDSHGNVTSHLTGLFSRAANLLARGIRLVFVFDGEVPELKTRELERRRVRKAQAQAQYEVAKRDKDVAGMRTFARQTSRLTREMVGQAKQLLDALGVPWIDAPSEGEAQAAALVKQGHAWAVVSQDADALMYGSPRVVKNLAITGRRKLPGRMAYVNVEPELILFREVLQELGLSLEQLRVLGILIGTDYNPGGVKGIGPKKGLKLVREHPVDELFSRVKWPDQSGANWRDILKLFEEMPVVDPGKISFGRVNDEAVRELLIERHEFSEARITSTLERLLKERQNTQTGLGEYF